MRIVHLFLLGASSAALTIGSTANAAPIPSTVERTVTVEFDKKIFGDTGSDSVRITFPQLKDDTESQSANVPAGRFQGTASNLVGVDASIFVDDVNDLFMYCYDLYEYIWGGRAVTYTINFGGPTARTLDVLGAINYVMNGGQPVDYTRKSGNNASSPWFAWLHPKTPSQSAAIQLAIWESLYEKTDSAWDLDNGSFQASGLEGDTIAFWNAIDVAVESGKVKELPKELAMTLESPLAQDMLTADPPTVPLPGTLALLGIGLAGLGVARRRA